MCGRLADARRAYERAVAVAGWTGDPVARAWAALGLGGVWVNEHRSEVERTRVLALQRTALAELPAMPSISVAVWSCGLPQKTYTTAHQSSP